ncbi:hypothetical protein [Paraburkholderia caffeinitolerans]|uniref:hypothetical protein n=1 Tax=Paraburkholderia caffeinitolerans TaxID=1723730 RepID=UPI0015838B4E|nr:hypothetical protein [Paraburkholderia caffeinitolerans]
MIFQFSNCDAVGLQELYPLFAIPMGGGRSFHSLRPLFGAQLFQQDDAMVNTPFFARARNLHHSPQDYPLF